MTDSRTFGGLGRPCPNCGYEGCNLCRATRAAEVIREAGLREATDWIESNICQRNGSQVVILAPRSLEELTGLVAACIAYGREVKSAPVNLPKQEIRNFQRIDTEENNSEEEISEHYHEYTRSRMELLEL